MLVLRRKPGESVLIGDDIEIEILDVNSRGVKVGIRAPRGYSILRKELKTTEDQNRLAALSPGLSRVADVLKNLDLTSSSSHPGR